MTPLDQLVAAGSEQDAAAAAARHGTPRKYLGVPNDALDALVAEWRADLDIDARVALAAELWETDIHDARIAAARLLVQARMRPDNDAWALLCEWVEQLDTWAIADAVAKAAERRIGTDPERLDIAADWTMSENSWARRTALLATAPVSKKNHLKADELAARDQVLDWIVGLLPDRNWHVQKAIASWLRSLARHDAVLARAFMAEHGEAMRGFTRKDIATRL